MTKYLKVFHQQFKATKLVSLFGAKFPCARLSSLHMYGIWHRFLHLKRQLPVSRLHRMFVFIAFRSTATVSYITVHKFCKRLFTGFSVVQVLIRLTSVTTVREE